jgi:hypothetical protein
MKFDALAASVVGATEGVRSNHALSLSTKLANVVGLAQWQSIGFVAPKGHGR